MFHLKDSELLVAPMNWSGLLLRRLTSAIVTTHCHGETSMLTCHHSECGGSMVPNYFN